MVKERALQTPELLDHLRKRVIKILERDGISSLVDLHEAQSVFDYDPKSHPKLASTLFAPKNLRNTLFELKIGNLPLQLRYADIEKLTLGDYSQKDTALFVHIVFAKAGLRILAKVDLIKKHLEFFYPSNGSEKLLERRDVRIANPQLQEILNIVNEL